MKSVIYSHAAAGVLNVSQMIRRLTPTGETAKISPRRIVGKVPKPYPGFPLFAHRAGCWCKKLGGRQPSFGPVRWPDPVEYEKSWRDALERYNKHRERVARGLAFAADPRAIDVQTLVDGFLTLKHAAAEAGRVKPRTFASIRATLRDYRQAIGAKSTVGDLEKDPARIRAYVAKLDGTGFHAANRATQAINAMWNWAASPAAGLLDRPFRWSVLHTRRPMREFRRQRRLARAAGQRETFDADEVAALIDHAPAQVHTMILLGYFCGYGNTDLAELPRNAITVYERDEAIHVRGRPEVIPAGWGMIDFPRPKTEVDRVAIIPPIVVEAVHAVAALKMPAATKRERQLVFRTAGGRRVVYDVEHRDVAGLIEKTTPTDNVAQQFSRLMKSVGWCAEHGWVRRKGFVRGERAVGANSRSATRTAAPNLCSTCGKVIRLMQPRGFYTLRHTALTFAAGSGVSGDARNLFEGHGSGGVRQAFYLDPTKLHDLYLIARELAARLELTRADLAARPPGGGRGQSVDGAKGGLT